MTNYYLGKIREIKDRLTYEIRVDIAGVVEDKPAFPLRGEVDEPKVGDYVILRNIDHVFGSMYLYSKLKEDDYIGFRSNGKNVTITPDYVEMSVYKRNGDQDAHDDFGNNYTKVKLYESGDIEIIAGNGGNLTVKVEGNTSITTNGTTDIKSGGPLTIDAPKVTLTGLQAIPGVSGSLNCVTVCPFTGVTHYLDFGIKG